MAPFPARSHPPRWSRPGRIRGGQPVVSSRSLVVSSRSLDPFTRPGPFTRASFAPPALVQLTHPARRAAAVPLRFCSRVRWLSSRCHRPRSRSTEVTPLCLNLARPLPYRVSSPLDTASGLGVAPPLPSARYLPPPRRSAAARLLWILPYPCAMGCDPETDPNPNPNPAPTPTPTLTR